MNGVTSQAQAVTRVCENHWLPGFNFNVEEWGAQYETLADCATLELASVVFEAAIAKKPAGRFMIRSRTRC